VRRGAASCRAVLAAVQWRRRSGRGAGAITAEPSWVERPGRRDRARSDCPAAGRRSRGCPDAGQTGRCPVRLVRSTVGMSVQPVERTSGVQASGASRCPGHPGVRTDRPLVSAALPPRDPRRAGLWSGSVGGPPQPGAASRRAPCPRAAWSPARIGPDGKGGGGVGRACLARRLTVARAAAWPASRLRRRLAAGPTAGAGPGQGASRVAGEHGTEQVLPGPRRASWAGRRCDARPWAWTKRW
jgi:hypothetical protein